MAFEQHMRIGQRKDHASNMAREKEAQEKARTQAMQEQTRRLKIENAERLMTLIERAIKNGVDPAAFKRELLLMRQP